MAALTPFSGSTDGRGILITSIASDAGVTIHTATASTTVQSRVYLWAQNNSANPVTLTIQFGGTGNPNDFIVREIPARVGLVPICEGQPLQNALVVKAFASEKNAISVFGGVQAGDTVANLYAVPIDRYKAPTALQTPIGTATTSILGLIDNTYLTGAPSAETTDLKAATASPKGRFLFAVPPNYSAGTSLTVTLNAGMKTTVSDTTATIDVQCVRQAAPTVDICATDAQSINSLTASNIAFTLTGTNVIPGDILDIMVTVAILDSATATAVIGKLNKTTISLTATANT